MKKKARKPRFTQQDTHKKAKLKEAWKRPRGIDSKLRLHLRGHKKEPSKGYRSPAAVRGLTDKGLQPRVIHDPTVIPSLQAKTSGIIIGKSVGMKKRLDIIEAAIRKKITILNISHAEDFLTKAKEEFAQRKAATQEKRKAKESKKKDTQKKAEEKAKDSTEEPKAKNEGLASKIEEEKKKEEKKEMDKTLIHSA